MEVTKPRCSNPYVDIRMVKFIILNVRIKRDMKEAFILRCRQILIDVNRELGGWHDRNLTEKTEVICLCLRLECNKFYSHQLLTVWRRELDSRLHTVSVTGILNICCHITTIDDNTF